MRAISSYYFFETPRHRRTRSSRSMSAFRPLIKPPCHEVTKSSNTIRNYHAPLRKSLWQCSSSATPRTWSPPYTGSVWQEELLHNYPTRSWRMASVVCPGTLTSKPEINTFGRQAWPRSSQVDARLESLNPIIPSNNDARYSRILSRYSQCTFSPLCASSCVIKFFIAPLIYRR